ncbi:MAG: type IX secretion system membrane protein PorP/SprF [Bacteroidota bacterium]
MPKLNALFTVILLLKLIAVYAQEPLTTENRFSNLSRNPALAGIQVEDLTINLCYHRQIKTALIPYRSLQIQIESRFKRKETEDGFTAGAIIRYDEAGDNSLKRAQFIPVLNFHKSLSEVKLSYLSMGFMTGVFKTQFDPYTVPTVKNYKPIPFNPATPVPQFLLPNSSNYFDFSTGVSLYTELDNHISLNLGAALFHFCQNTLKQYIDIPKTPREWVVNSGLYFNKWNYSFQIITDLRINKNETKMYTAFIWGIPIHENFLNQLTEIQIGAYYNTSKELSPAISISWPSFLISFSSNFLIGKQNKLPLLENAFETNISINTNCHKRNNESEKVKCHF